MRALRLVVPFLLLVGCGRAQVDMLGQLSSSGDTGVSEDPRDGGSIVTPRDGGPMTQPRDSGVVTPPPPRDGGVVMPPPRDGGTAACNIDSDCFRDLGRPICPQGQRGDWDCVFGSCQLVCPPPPECFNDCDCPFELACAAGQCMPLSRNNRCCFAPFCPPGDSCQLPGGGTGLCPSPPDGGVRDGGIWDGGGPPPPPDAGVETPVGDACMSSGACGPLGFCIEDSSGFPDGYCTQNCGPQGAMCPAGSDCRDFGPRQDLCLDTCTTTSECRMGYGCIQLGIDPQKVCWPVSSGSTNPNGDPVGSACTNDQACAAGLTCLQFQGWPGGYCTKQYCDAMNNPCPSSSQCYAFPGMFSLCLAQCPNGGSQSTCRTDYYCFGAMGSPGACIPD